MIKAKQFKAWMLIACLLFMAVPSAATAAESLGAGNLGSGNPSPGTSLGPGIEMTSYSDWPSGFADRSAYFPEAVFDGEHIWMIPQETNQVVKLDPETGEMTGHANWPAGFNLSNGAFSGGVFDGKSIWMIPAIADRVVIVDTETGAMTDFNHWPDDFASSSGPYFNGGVFDGEFVWLITSNGNMLVKVDPATGERTGYNDWPDGFVKGNYAFSGAVYDGRNIWLIPSLADRVIKVDTETGVMTGYSDWPSGFAAQSYKFRDGIFDGHSVWLLPNSANMVIRLDPRTGEMTGFNDWPSGFDESGSPGLSLGAFDGQYIWTKYGQHHFYRIDTSSGEIEAFDKPNAYGGSYSPVFDGLNVWMIPFGKVSGTVSAEIFRLSSVPVMHPAQADKGEVSLSWTPVNGAIGYSISQSLQPLAGGTEIATVTDSVYTITDLPIRVTHYYTVKAIYPNRASMESNEVSVTLLSHDTDLSGLSLSQGTLSPAFDAGTTAYSADVGNDVQSVTVTPATSDAEAIVTVNGDSVANGEASATIPLTVGTNTILVEVAAPDGTEKAYTVTVARAAANNPGWGWLPVVNRPMIDLNGKLVDPRDIDVSRPSATLRTELRDDRLYVDIPVSVLEALAGDNDQFSIQVEAPVGGFAMRIAELLPGIRQLLEESGLQTIDATLKVALTDRSDDPAWLERIGHNAANGEKISAILHYETTIVDARNKDSISTANLLSAAMSQTLSLSGTNSDLPRYWGAFRYNELTDQLEFVPARKADIEAEGAVAIPSVKNGAFVLLANRSTFRDMDNHWGAHEANLAAAKGLIRGVGDGRFNPNRNITSAEFGYLLERAFGYDATAEFALGPLPLIREQMAAMIARAIEPYSFAKSEGELGVSGDVSDQQNLGDSGDHGYPDFLDIRSANPAYVESIDLVARLHLVFGMGDGTFRPQGETTRAQAAAILVRALVLLDLIDDPL